MEKATHEAAIDSEIYENLEAKLTGKNPIAQHIIEAVEQSQEVTLEDTEILLQVIQENRSKNGGVHKLSG